MSQVVPVIYREGMLVPQVQLENVEEGQRFEILIPEPDEKAFLQDASDFWSGFISSEDAQLMVRQTKGQFGPIPLALLEEIAMDESLLEGSMNL